MNSRSNIINTSITLAARERRLGALRAYALVRWLAHFDQYLTVEEEIGSIVVFECVRLLDGHEIGGVFEIVQ